MKRLIAKAGKAVVALVTSILMPLVFILSFLLHFPCYLLSNRVSIDD